MPGTEGVIQFRYELEPAAGDDVAPPILQRMNAVRDVLRSLRLVGVDARNGLGYGNLSARLPGSAAFHITASQTGGLGELSSADICRVDGWDAERFHVRATGARPPSSEALTHAMIYDGDDRANWVLHVHSAAVWRAAGTLRLPATAHDAGYGSPAMAKSVRGLLSTHGHRPLVFVTPGHEDGVFALGTDAAGTTAALVAVLVRARAEAAEG